jgi:hypothetical protein
VIKKREVVWNLLVLLGPVAIMVVVFLIVFRIQEKKKDTH